MRRVLALMVIVLVGTSLNDHVLAQGREVTLRASSKRITYASSVVLTGQILPEDQGACTNGVEVTIFFDAMDDRSDGWHPVGYTRTTEQGEFRESIVPEKSGDYQARVENEPVGCGSAVSPDVRVFVRVRVRMSPLKRVIDASDRARLLVVVDPLCRENSRPAKVSIYQFREGRFRKVVSKRPGHDCEIVFKRDIEKLAVFQARIQRIIALHWFYSAGRSTQQVVAVRGS